MRRTSNIELPTSNVEPLCGLFLWLVSGFTAEDAEIAEKRVFQTQISLINTDCMMCSMEGKKDETGRRASQAAVDFSLHRGRVGRDFCHVPHLTLCHWSGDHICVWQDRRKGGAAPRFHWLDFCHFCGHDYNGRLVFCSLRNRSRTIPCTPQALSILSCHGRSRMHFHAVRYGSWRFHNYCLNARVNKGTIFGQK